ncbi:hypothetical protein AB0H82_18315 [Streptomyces sp. NPDC050732]|uniref:hypothetical protein n=1 Tax=Streptomyces sp. NPDC050732 TaxID=3154632 RepID=UPI00343F2C35
MGRVRSQAGPRHAVVFETKPITLALREVVPGTDLASVAQPGTGAAIRLHATDVQAPARRPGLSNSELARGAFVTRQSMNVLLQTLEKASAAVRSVEVGMLAGMTEAERSGASRILQSMIHSLRDGNGGADGSAAALSR